MIPETKTLCPKCGSKVYHNKGVGKTSGKPYENYKCKNKDCDFIEWVESKKSDTANKDIVLEKLDEILSLLKSKKGNKDEISDYELEL